MERSKEKDIEDEDIDSDLSIAAEAVGYMQDDAGFDY